MSADIDAALAALEVSRTKMEESIRKLDEQAASLKRRKDGEGGSNNTETTEVQSPPTCVTECEGNIFSSTHDSHLVHCVGGDFRMAAGIAVDFREKFGGVDVLLRQNIKVGGVGELDREGRKIFYLVTKRYSNDKPTLESLQKCLEALMQRSQELGITSLSMPRIGCGLDGLKWTEVKPLIEKIFSRSTTVITVYNVEKPPQNVGRKKTIPTRPPFNNWLRKQYYKPRQHPTANIVEDRSRGERSAGERDRRERSAGERDRRERSAGERDRRERSAGERDRRERSAGERDRRERSAGERDRRERSAGERDRRERSWRRNENDRGDRSWSDRRNRSRDANYRSDRTERKRSREHDKERSRGSRSREVGRMSNKSYRKDNKTYMRDSVGQGKRSMRGGNRNAAGGKSGGGDQGVHYHIHLNK